MSKNQINIVQISATITPQGTMIFGLGTDGKIYAWNSKDNGSWILNATPPAAEVAGGLAPGAVAPASDAIKKAADARRAARQAALKKDSGKKGK